MFKVGDKIIAFQKVANQIPKDKPFVCIELPKSVAQALILDINSGNAKVTECQSGIRHSNRWEERHP